MAGRLVTDTRVKSGEVLPLDVIHLTDEADKQVQRAADIRSVFQVAHKLDQMISKHYDMVVAEPRVVLEAESESDVEEKKKEGRSSRERYLSKRKAIKEMKAPTAGEKHMYPTKERHNLRADILSVSLFPNLYNRETLLASM